MEIKATIKNFKPYTALYEYPSKFEKYPITTLTQNLNLLPNNFIVEAGTSIYAVSKWTGSKRSRTYPYQLVYNTLNHKPKVALIPCVKDEGKGGDRDFIQYDTISLMTLLGVYVILTYHISAERSSVTNSKGHPKVTNHQIDAKYVYQRMEELTHYQSDPFHWNQLEIDNHYTDVMSKAIKGHNVIEEKTGVPLKNSKEITKRAFVENFKNASRNRARQAQTREQSFTQESERLLGEKGTIDIQNQYNGIYHFTVDEALINSDVLLLIEKKHSGKKIMPSSSDIKDGLLKIALYCNIQYAVVGKENYTSFPVLGLTSNKISGYCHSRMNPSKLQNFFNINPSFTNTYVKKVEMLFEEAQKNGLVVFLVNADKEEQFRKTMLPEIIATQ